MTLSIRVRSSRQILQLEPHEKKGSSIDVYVSSGSKGFALKDYKGKNYKDAIEDLTSNYGVSEDQLIFSMSKTTVLKREKSYLKVQGKTSLSIPKDSKAKD